ncbi:MAG: ABC transporter permease [Bacillota bacterium]
MLKRDLLLMANRNLWRRRARTILTCLGVLIGTASIVVMLSLGIGLKESMEKSMAQWGSLNIIRVHPGMQFDREGNPTGQERRLNDETVAELKAIPGVVAVSPTYTVYGEAMLGRKRGHLSLVGVDLQAMEDLEFTLAHGRLPSPEERFTVVAGYQVINNFWDEKAMRRGDYHQYEQQDPADLLDQRLSITINNQANYEKKQTFNVFVVGILDEKNMERSWEVYGSITDIKRMHDFMLQGTNYQGDTFYGPGMGRRGTVAPATAQTSKSPGGRDDRRNDYNSIMVRTKDVAETKRVSAELRERGFNAWSMADGLEGIERTSRTIQAILGGIGGITLFVAALGITNTMVMSIYERTREIGIMKVIGASFTDVRALFLAEASLIGLFGGIFGLGLSFGASAIINKVSSEYMQRGMMGGAVGGEAVNISIIPPWLALFAVVFAIFIGLGSGLYPANRAIKLSPIVAIRNE